MTEKIVSTRTIRNMLPLKIRNYPEEAILHLVI
jgi:hypothetical protein